MLLSMKKHIPSFAHAEEIPRHSKLLMMGLARCHNPTAQRSDQRSGHYVRACALYFHQSNCPGLKMMQNPDTLYDIEVLLKLAKIKYLPASYLQVFCWSAANSSDNMDVKDAMRVRERHIMSNVDMGNVSKTQNVLSLSGYPAKVILAAAVLCHWRWWHRSGLADQSSLLALF